jgi:hypothetical protein
MKSAKSAFTIWLGLCLIIVLFVVVERRLDHHRRASKPAIRSSTVPQLYAFDSGPHRYLTRSAQDERASFVHAPDCLCNLKAVKP